MSSLLEAFAAKGKTSETNYTSRDEARFWLRARRNKKLAHWTCDLTDEDNQNYLRLLLDADFASIETAAAESFLMLKIRNDLMGFGIFLTPAQLDEVCRGFEREALIEQQHL